MRGWWRRRNRCEGGSFPIRLKPEDWQSGSINWLLDVIAPDRKTAGRVIGNFKQVVKEGELRMHPQIAGLIDGETLEKNRTGRSQVGANFRSRLSIRHPPITQNAAHREEHPMRSFKPNKEPITDSLTGSTLVYEGPMGGRDGGRTYRFDYHSDQQGAPLAFGLRVAEFTSFMFDQHRAKRKLPEISVFGNLEEWRKLIAEFAERYGDFNRVEEWYLIGTDDRWMQDPSEAKCTWSGFSLDEGRRIIDTFFRLYFELYARRPGVTSDDPSERYYPDLLEFKPYNLPPQLIEKRRAAPGEDI